jgi:Zn-dependent protease
MGLYDRHYHRADDEDDRGGSLGRAWRRITEGESFFSWSLPLFTAFGIRVRVHLIFVLLAVAQLIHSAVRRDVIGVGYTAYAIVALFVLVLLHEFGHCFACRRVGGEADEILMWPLGGLASCSPPHRWGASLVTTLGGPAVNAVLVPVLGLAVLALGLGWNALVFNPFDPGAALRTAQVTTHAERCVWWLYYVNLLLLLFNMLLPMYPLDAGRIVQEVLWRRLGYERSMWISVNVGLFLAVAVGLFALLGGGGYLLGVAIFAGITCYQQKRALLFARLEDGGVAAGGFGAAWSDGGASGGGRGADESSRKYRQALRRQQRERQEQAEVDRILAKIAASGLNSLTRRERRALRRATERKRGGAVT